MTRKTTKTDELFSAGRILLYRTEDGRRRIEVRLQDESVWLSQLGIAELFQTTKQNISLHLKNIFSDEELPEERVVKEYLTTAADGKSYQTRYYNLESKLCLLCGRLRQGWSTEMYY